MITKKDKIIREFYEYLNPPEDYETIAAICKTPFFSLVNTIKAGTLFEVRFLKFGKFAIHGGVIVRTLLYNQQQYEKGFMREKDYLKFIESFNNLYKRHPEKFKKYEQVIEQWKYL